MGLDRAGADEVDARQRPRREVTRMILAWHKRNDPLRRQTGRRLDPGRGSRMAGWMGV